ncbi:TPA: hypothetical protein U0928_002065 [Streptococcus suis 11538]|uniref:Conjugative transposon protein n=1 Tax=Streptococcus suis 6407 TaxID=1214179 RepID=A0A075SPQ9_STRSU|nr:MULTISPECIES: hypothetical protein [Streptococcus]HEL2623950.1 hypothetical protein [Streptococcus suis]AIG43005.1 hypothetical protein ID09_02685 [Streptococcus suis 6407]VTT02339.1 Uncharacterised protein [Streptococcus dysgalactiae]HEL2636088.1 hypothetical protein [Streptococcus suis]HEM2593005.1 hypothetical protein [Streptococcus suis]
MTWNFDTMKEALSEMEKVNYQEFIKVFLSLELSISDRTILNQVYQDYMDEDDLSLISDELRDKVDGYQDEVKADMTDILEKLYRTGEGSIFIMDVMSSNSLSDTMNQYEILDSEDYSLIGLETLQAMIQQDLAISSQDYFGDLVHLALQKDLLDQKSHFLQHFVATVMEGIPQERDQRALVLD